MGTNVGLRVTFYVSGVRTTVEGMRQFGKLAKTFLAKHITATAESILHAARSQVPTDTMDLINSLQIAPLRIRKYSGKQVEVTIPYGTWVEFGTWMPGKPKQATKPPYAPGTPLAQWAERHGLPPAGVASGIGERGVKKQPFMTPAMLKYRQAYYDGAIRIIFGEVPTKVYQSTGRLSLRTMTEGVPA